MTRFVANFLLLLLAADDNYLNRAAAMSPSIGRQPCGAFDRLQGPVSEVRTIDGVPSIIQSAQADGRTSSRFGLVSFVAPVHFFGLFFSARSIFLRPNFQRIGGAQFQKVCQWPPHEKRHFVPQLGEIAPLLAQTDEISDNLLLFFSCQSSRSETIT